MQGLRSSAGLKLCLDRVPDTAVPQGGVPLGDCYPGG
jgi:hypothetical protein